MNENSYTEALRALHEALVQLKAESKDHDLLLQQINIVLEKQGLVGWDAGTVVSKDHCDKSHNALTCTVAKTITDFKKTINNKILASWVVLTFILSGFGTLITLLLKEVF